MTKEEFNGLFSCDNCGVVIDVTHSQLGDPRFCGVECYVQYMEQEKEDGCDNNMWWQGDESQDYN